VPGEHGGPRHVKGAEPVDDAPGHVLADPQRFPAVSAFIAAGVFDAADGPDDEFIFGLDRILDGIATLIGATDGS
jgi:hypothetical protein